MRNESHISRQSSVNCGHVINTLLQVFAKELMPVVLVYNNKRFVLCTRSKQEQKVKGFCRAGTDLVREWVKRKCPSPQSDNSAISEWLWSTKNCACPRQHPHKNTQLRLCNLFALHITAEDSSTCSALSNRKQRKRYLLTVLPSRNGSLLDDTMLLYSMCNGLCAALHVQIYRDGS